MRDDAAARQELEARIARLERAQRRMRWGHLVLALLLVGACAREPAVPTEIRAREFKVVGHTARCSRASAPCPGRRRER